ncbi:putative inosine/xanthosine triphosphatase [Frankliniella fusca]|uniref:Inosine/xanthosine triphosphatase n=1 Tax=Frankliniella fusca TaxID=407009 RepID=A0AAE1GWT9_9NEOP|nr:putative inosine/xanthosine triphosphatase [Frankliniella fusca]
MVDHGYSQVSQEGPIPSNTEVPQEGPKPSTSNNETFEDKFITCESSDIKMILSTSVPSTLENVVDVEAPNEDLLLQVKRKLELFTGKRWLIVVWNEELNCVYYSAQQCFTSQRCLTANTAGDVKLFVHNVPVSIDPFTKDLQPPEPLDIESVDSAYVDKIASIMNNVQKMELCSGYDDEMFQAAWSSCSVGVVDRNPFLECRYVETIRSPNCFLLVPSNKWRCSECLKLYKPLKKLTNAINLEERPVFTANKFLTEKQKLSKLAKKQIDLKNAQKKIVRLRERMQEVIRKEAVVLYPSVAEDLSEILKNCTISPAQSVFLQQQIKASQVKKWHEMAPDHDQVRFVCASHIACSL